VHLLEFGLSQPCRVRRWVHAALSRMNYGNALSQVDIFYRTLLLGANPDRATTMYCTA
jgi:hypothetical protein